MICVNLKTPKENTPYAKNVLYKIEGTRTVSFEERHEDSSEQVDLEYCLEGQQYGIFASEYRSPNVLKQGCKTADVLTCVVDESAKVIDSLIFDVKSNISAFSDDLSKGNAMLTAIKEVRDFVEQIHDEILHKNSFMLYYKDEGYIERERIGIVTKNFESEKFLAVANQLEGLLKTEDTQVSRLISIKLKNALNPYANEIERIRDFSEKTVKISGQIYELQVFLLKQIRIAQYAISIKVAGTGIK